MFGKIFPCDLCKKTFSRNGDLTRHKAIHSGEKNHECAVCGMRFAQHSGLKTHRNTHTGEKPHRCNYCGKAFGDPSSCARHEKEKHFGKPFLCQWCPSSIVRRSSFADHVRKKHPEIGHLVTKEFLDKLEGPHSLKPKNKRGRNRRGTIMHEPRPVLHGRPLTLTLDERKTDEVPPLSFHSQEFDVPFVNTMSMPQHPVQSPAQPVQQCHPVLEPLNFNFTGLSMYGGGLSHYDDASAGGGFDARSEASSPGPITPLDIKPPTFVEPSKINPYDYDFSLFGSEEQTTPFYVPPLYSYVPEQQGLPLFGL